MKIEITPQTVAEISRSIGQFALVQQEIARLKEPELLAGRVAQFAHEAIQHEIAKRVELELFDELKAKKEVKPAERFHAYLRKTLLGTSRDPLDQDEVSVTISAQYLRENLELTPEEMNAACEQLAEGNEVQIDWSGDNGPILTYVRPH